MEFTIKSRPDNNFRIGTIKPTEILALSMTVDLDDYKKSQELFTFALEHTEVKMGDNWTPVKAKDREVYMPMGIEKEIISLREIIEVFLNEVIAKAF